MLDSLRQSGPVRAAGRAAARLPPRKHDCLAIVVYEYNGGNNSGNYSRNNKRKSKETRCIRHGMAVKD